MSRQRRATSLPQLSEFDLSWPHESDAPRGWETLDADIHDFIIEVVESMKRRLTGFAGAYLHGSLATGSFYRGKSDIDMFLVVDRTISRADRAQATTELARLSDRRPITGDLELSVYRETGAYEPQQPVVLEVHYSEAHAAAIKAGEVDYAEDRADPDAPAHIFNAQRRGIVLDGEPIAHVLDPVPLSTFKDAARHDIGWILDGTNILDTPIYGTLNCCRWLANESEGWEPPANKDEGGDWALGHLHIEHRPIVAQALCCHRSRELVDPKQRRTDGHQWDQDKVLAFRDYVSSLL